MPRKIDYGKLALNLTYSSETYNISLLLEPHNTDETVLPLPSLHGKKDMIFI